MPTAEDPKILRDSEIDPAALKPLIEGRRSVWLVALRLGDDAKMLFQKNEFVIPDEKPEVVLRDLAVEAFDKIGALAVFVFESEPSKEDLALTTSGAAMPDTVIVVLMAPALVGPWAALLTLAEGTPVFFVPISLADGGAASEVGKTLASEDLLDTLASFMAAQPQCDGLLIFTTLPTKQTLAAFSVFEEVETGRRVCMPREGEEAPKGFVQWLDAAELREAFAAAEEEAQAANEVELTAQAAEEEAGEEEEDDVDPDEVRAQLGEE